MNIRPIALSLALAAAACGSDPEEAAATAAVAGDLAGTYDFVLEASDVAPKLRARCAGDAACWSEVEHDAATEKIRFTRAPSGELVFTSFSTDDGHGREEVFVEVPLSAARAGEDVVLAKSAGLPRGTLAGTLAYARASLRIETRPDGTIAIVDPNKGRLVYRRASSG